jgi:hypothetical protein
MPDYTKAIADLELRIEELKAEIRTRENELTKSRVALGALRSFAVPGERRGTYVLLREYIASLPPNTEIDQKAALTYMNDHGWESVSMVRLNAMQQAMAKLAKQDEIKRGPGKSRYYTLGGNEDTAERMHELADSIKSYASMGEQPHNPAGCNRNGEPHLGPCEEITEE